MNDQQTRGLHSPPWEEQARYGFVNALVETIRQVLLAPTRFFQSMPTGLGTTAPLLFAVTLAVIGALFDWMWQLAVGGVPGLAEWLRHPVFGTWSLLLAPVLAVAMVVIRAAVFHGMLIVLGAPRLGFEATLRVVAYARATRLLAAIPVCGGAVGLIWELVVDVIGLERVHGCESWQAVVAVVVPALLGGLLLGVALATTLGVLWIS